MLPLFGRIGIKVPTVVTLNDEWCIPTDQEIFGRSRKIEEVVLETVNEVSNETATNESNSTGATKSFQSMNEITMMDDGEGVFSNITTADGEDTFSIMNYETTIVNAIEDLEIVDDSCAEKSSNVIEIDMNSVLIKLRDLERKYEELNSKVAECEDMRTRKGNYADSTVPSFGNEFICMIQELMKNGMACQQGVIGKFIDELDGILDIDIDFTDIDPFK